MSRKCEKYEHIKDELVDLISDSLLNFTEHGFPRD